MTSPTRTPTSATWAALAVGLALVLLPFAAELAGNAWVRILCFALLYIMLALGLNIVVGYAGLLDLGFVAFYAVGAYVYALLTSPHLLEQFPALAAAFPHGFSLPVWLLLPLCAAVAALFGLLLGFPVLRLRGDYLAIVTLGFGEIIRIFMNNLNAPINLTNGPQGITGIEPLALAGHSMSKGLSLGPVSLNPLVLHYFVFLALAVLLLIVSIRLQQSRIGRAWMAIREDETAAKAMGIPTRTIKLLAFALGASFGGIAGALFSAFQGFVSPESFGLMESIVIVAMVVLGGMGNVWGVVMGAVLLYAIPEALRHFAEPAQFWLFGQELVAPEALRMLLFGSSMVLIMLLRPRGLLMPRGTKA
ncbi:MAG: hypothetical protein RLY30_1540 [Pseudomonadota bacterium]